MLNRGEMKSSKEKGKEGGLKGNIISRTTANAFSMAKMKSSALNKFQSKVSMIKNILPRHAICEVDLKIDKSLMTIKNQRTREVSLLIKLIMAILLLPQKMKKPEHFRFLRQTLKNESAFSELKKRVPKRVFHSLFEELRHEYISEHKLVYKSSETLKKFYVILEGEVYNLIERSRLLSNNENALELKDPYLRELYGHLEVSNILKPGDSFGGFSVICDDRQITTTVTKSIVHLAIIPFEIYKSLLGNSLYFRQLGKYSLQLLLFFCEEMKLEKGKCLFRIGDSANKIFFIRNGEVELSTQLHIRENSDSIIASDRNDMNSVDKRRRDQDSKKRIKLRLMLKGDVVGDVEVLEKQNERKYQATVVSRFCHLFAIRAEKFFDFVNREEAKNLFTQRKKNLENDILKFKELFSVPKKFVNEDSQLNSEFQSNSIKRIREACCLKGFASKPKDIIRSKIENAYFPIKTIMPKKEEDGLNLLHYELQNKVPHKHSPNLSGFFLKKSQNNKETKSNYQSKYVPSTAHTDKDDESISFLFKRILVNRPVNEETGMKRNLSFRPNSALASNLVSKSFSPDSGRNQTERGFSGRKIKRATSSHSKYFTPKKLFVKEKETTFSTYYLTFDSHP